MPESIAAVIYGALLSSRSSTEACSSSRSAVKVVLDGMRTTGPTNGFRASRHFSKARSQFHCLSPSSMTGFMLTQPQVGHNEFFGSLTTPINRPYSSLSCNPRLTRKKSIPSHSGMRGFNGEADQRTQQPLVSDEDLLEEPPPCDSQIPSTFHPALCRLRECVHHPPSNIRDILQIWYDLEQKHEDTASRWIAMASINEYFLRRFARILVRRSCASWDKPCPYPLEIADVIDAVLVEIGKRLRPVRRVEKYFLWHSKILRKEYSYVIQGIHYASHNSVVEGDAKLIRALTQLFVNCYHTDGLATAIDKLAPLSRLVFLHLDSKEDRFTDLLQIESQNLRESIFGAFSAVKDPLAWLTTVPKSTTVQHLAMRIFFRMYGKRRDADRSWRLFEYLQARKIIVPFDVHLSLLRIFIAQRAFQCAEGVNDSLRIHYKELVTDPNRRYEDEIRLNLRLASIQGDFHEAQELYDLLCARGFIVDRGTRRLLMHAYAVAGNPEYVEELFTESFSDGRLPVARDYRELIYGHVRAKNMTAVNHWLEEMVKSNVLPDLGIYNMILTALAHHIDAEAAIFLLSKMYENKIQPDKYSFATVMSILAMKRDPVGAERIYERAIREGIEPDEVMTMSLMNAHIEAGSWRGAIRVFDYLNVGRIRNSRYLGQLYNALLKAYVLIGAPFNVVFKIFRRFEALKLIPTLRSYTLLIQSACDSGRMDIARDLFLELDAQPTHGRLKSHVDAYLMTIIMAGFLRNGDKERARLVYEDMFSRDLHPGAVTFGIIIRSFADHGTADSLQMAESFMHGLLDVDQSRREWLKELRGGPHKALEVLFSPLMAIYGRDLDIDAVRRLHDYMLSVGGHPTIISLNILMDSYRHIGNFKAVRGIWLEIVEIAKRITQRDLLDCLPVFKNPMDDGVQPPPIEKTPGIFPYRANTLCISLSIYIEALSQAHQHLEIAKVWKEVRDLGFAFDAHNWNHLAVALMRAGEVERAFEIVERVLLPHQKQAEDIVRERKKNPSSPLFFVKSSVLSGRTTGGYGVDESTIDLSSTSASEIEEEVEDRRQQTVGSAVKSRRVESVRLSTRQQRKFRLTDLDTMEGSNLDLAQPLHELQQMSAHYQGWRTHTRTIQALRMVLRSLSVGKLVRATRDSQSALYESEEVVDTAEMRIQEKMASDRSNINRDDAEKLVAAEMMQRIMVQYPRSVMLIEEYFARGKPE